MSPLHQLLTLWVCVLSAVARPVQQDYAQGGLSAVITQGFGANYIVWACLLIASLLFVKERLFISKISLGIGLVALLLPFATLSWLAGAALAGMLAFQAQVKLPLVLFMLTCLREPLTAVCLKLFAGNILNADAIMTNAMLHLMGRDSVLADNIVQTAGGVPLLILTGCSVFSNLSYNSLLWFGLHVYFDKKISPLSGLLLILTMAVTLGANALRLALMSGSGSDYLFYHDGPGSQYFEWGGLALVGGVLIGGLRYVQHR